MVAEISRGEITLLAVYEGVRSGIGESPPFVASPLHFEWGFLFPFSHSLTNFNTFSLH